MVKNPGFSADLPCPAVVSRPTPCTATPRTCRYATPLELLALPPLETYTSSLGEEVYTSKMGIGWE